MRKTSWLLAAGCLLYTSLQAQSLRRGTEVNWVMAPVYKNSLFPSSSDFHRKQSILYVSETEAVIPYEISEKAKIVMGVKNQMSGLAKLNNRGQVKWQTELHNGTILGIARFQGDILVLSVPEWNSIKNSIAPLKQVKATLLNVANGKKLLEKDIPLTSTNYAQVGIHKNAEGEFLQMVVRHTKLPTSGLSFFNMNKHEKQVRQTESIQLYSITKELEAKQTASIAVTDPELQYFGALTDAAGNLDIVWATSESLTLERYKVGVSTPSIKLSTPFDWNEKTGPELVFAANPGNVDQVALAVRYMKGGFHIKTVQFDLAGKKTAVYDEAVEKSYMNTIEEKSEVPQGRSRNMKKSQFFGLKPADILFYGNQAIIAKQTEGNIQPTPQKVYYFTGDAFITVFNQDGTPQKHFLLTKNSDANAGFGNSFGLNLSGETLQFVTVDEVGLTSANVLYGAINLKEQKWEKLETVKDGVNYTRVESGSTLWFAGSAVVHSWESQGAFQPNPITVFKVLTQGK